MTKIEELKLLKRKDLFQKAKALEIKIKVGITNDDLIKAIIEAEKSSQKSEIKNIKKEEDIQLKKSEKSKKSENIEIPDDLAHLGLVSVKKLTPEEVNINHIISDAPLLTIPEKIKKRLEIMEYEISYPLMIKQVLQKKMESGWEFIRDDKGKTFRIYAQQSNEIGERLYHIAMKREKILREVEKQKHTERYYEQKRIIERTGDTSNIKGVEGSIPINSKEMQTFTKKDNNI